MMRPLVWMVWLLGAGTWLGFVLRWWAGDHFLIARLVNYFMPWFLLPLVPALGFAIYSQKRGLSLFLLPPLLAVLVTYAPLFWPVLHGRSIAAPPPNAPVLTVLSYNVWAHNDDIEAMARTIAEQRTDILLLQEIDAPKLARLIAALTPVYPGKLHFTHSPHLLQAIVAPHPIEPLDALRHKGQAQVARVRLPAAPVTVFNVHPLRRGGWQNRHRQIAALIDEEVARTPGPVILGGDFNTTDQTQLYRRVLRYLRNAHWEAGFGFGFTYPAPPARLLGPLPLPPLVRIDHIFFSRHFLPMAARTVADAGGSDHFPVVAELVLAERD